MLWFALIQLYFYEMVLYLFLRLLRQYAFWLLFFLICRSIFILYNLDELVNVGFSETISTFFHALYLDTSFAGYLLALCVVFILFSAFVPHKLVLKIHKVYVVVIVFFLSLITIAEP